MENRKRLHEIDFTKGVLVVVMVAYHTLNYFLLGKGIYYLYIIYVAEAFIFFSGVVCAIFYSDAYEKNRKSVQKRLIIRSAKLVSIFLLSNVVIVLTIRREDFLSKIDGKNAIDIINDLLILGNPKICSFEIILPIAYLLFFCIFLLYTKKWAELIYCIYVVAYIYISIENLYMAYNIKCLYIGIGGFYSGVIFKKYSVNLNKSIYKNLCISLAALYFFILIPFNFSLSSFSYYVLINIVVISLSSIGGFINNKNYLNIVVFKFGQYSLILYLLQMLYIQIMQFATKYKTKEMSIAIISIFIFINLLLYLSTYTLIYLRKRYKAIDSAYKLVFQ